ncbi:hypothetical protein NIES2101_38760 [Calothrix sp. HK-06]|nr:hypothetical protein NIES2101_38760 [Calothrix sp. HK-06]
MNLYYISKLIIICLCLNILIGSLFTLAQSELAYNSTYLPDEVVFHENFDPPGEPEPKTTSGAGSRDIQRCGQDEAPIKPLMPRSNFGLTFEEHPSVFMSLRKTSAKRVVLALRDKTGKYYERAFLPIPTNQQIVSFKLPTEKSPLRIGKNYQWSLVVVCGNKVEPDDPIFSGWLQRVARTPQMDKELVNKPPIWQAKWYGERGYWYEMLMAIEEAKKTQPNNVQLNILLQKFWQSMDLNI